MKKSFYVLAVLVLAVAMMASASAEVVSKDCAPKIELLNQDPYPANPGEYVKVVFQINGLENPNCKKVVFSVNENFPFSLEPGSQNEVNVYGSAYVRNYNSTALIPYNLMVDKDAADGDNEIEVAMQIVKASGEVVSQVEQFMINVQGVKVDFDLSIKDFDSSTNTLTFEILNIGESDITALVAEIPKQDNVVVKGSNRNIIGDLDASDDTTFKFEAMPKDGEIDVALAYTDSINKRREAMKKVYYDSSYFTDRKKDQAPAKSGYYYLFWLLLLINVVLFVRRWWKRRKKKDKKSF